MVVGGEVWPEKPNGGEVDRPLGEQVEDDGEPAGGAGGVDTVVGLVLGQTEDVPTVDEQGRIALAEVDVAGVELGEVGDELGGRLTLGSGEALQARDEVGVGEATQGNEEFVRHVRLYHARRTQWVRASGKENPR